LRFPFSRTRIADPALPFAICHLLVGLDDGTEFYPPPTMDESKFNRLSFAERAGIVWRHGQFVDSVMFNNYCLMLYSVNRQFVELYLDLKTHSIVWISLANEHDLAKYLEHVRIEV
jgi:hypothetical protein